jgi:hypothetical protein
VSYHPLVLDYQILVRNAMTRLWIGNRNEIAQRLRLGQDGRSRNPLNSTNISRVAGALVLLSCSTWAQSGKAPSVSMAPVGPVTAQSGKQTTVTLNFRVASGFHVNSNTPKDEFLIPTGLKMDPPTDIVLGKIDYPDGKDVSFPFSPDTKLNVYSGDFAITLMVHPLTSVVPGKYAMRGVLRYQACDNAQCFPPKTLPINFDVKVVKGPAAPRHNPRQSPHVHS